MEKFLKRLLCGFRKAHSRQHALFRMLQSLLSKLQKQSFADVLQNRCSKKFLKLHWKRLLLDSVRPATLLRTDFNTSGFLWNLGNLLEHLLLQDISGGCFSNLTNRIMLGLYLWAYQKHMIIYHMVFFFQILRLILSMKKSYLWHETLLLITGSAMEEIPLLVIAVIDQRRI